MSIALSLVAIILSVFAAFMPAFVAFFPGIFHAGTLYQLRLKRWILLSLTLVMSVSVYALKPGAGGMVTLIMWAVLAAVSIRLNPARAIRALDQPPRIPAAEAVLDGEELVVGHTWNGQAVAWPNRMVVPHHLINDRAGDKPILVAH